MSLSTSQPLSKTAIPLGFAMPNPNPFPGTLSSPSLPPAAFNPTSSLHDHPTTTPPAEQTSTLPPPSPASRTSHPPVPASPGSSSHSTQGINASVSASAKGQGEAQAQRQMGFPEYGPGAFGGRGSVAIPLLCILSLALTAALVVYIGWKRMERRKRAEHARAARQRDLRALRKSTLRIDV